MVDMMVTKVRGYVRPTYKLLKTSNKEMSYVNPKGQKTKRLSD